MKPHGSRGCFGLTPRQTDLLELMMQGHSNKLIARELGLSVETVKDHVAAIFHVLKVSSRTQAMSSRAGSLAAAYRARKRLQVTPGMCDCQRTWTGVSTVLESRLRASNVGRLIQELGPGTHRLCTFIEPIASPVSLLGLVLERVRERHFDDFARGMLVHSVAQVLKVARVRGAQRRPAWAGR